MEIVRTGRDNLASNEGEAAANRAPEGRGITLRAEGNIDRHLRSGRLVHLLPR